MSFENFPFWYSASTDFNKSFTSIFDLIQFSPFWMRTKRSSLTNVKDTSWFWLSRFWMLPEIMKRWSFNGAKCVSWQKQSYFSRIWWFSLPIPLEPWSAWNLASRRCMKCPDSVDNNSIHQIRKPLVRLQLPSTSFCYLKMIIEFTLLRSSKTCTSWSYLWNRHSADTEIQWGIVRWNLCCNRFGTILLSRCCSPRHPKGSWADEAFR